jgi:biopolymer transport protein ExbD
MSIGTSEQDHSLDEMHEINVTPFIDVILVLLIVFMVAAPFSTVDVPVDLPATSAQPQARPPKPLYLTVKADLTLAAGETPAPRDMLGQVLTQAANGDKSTRIFVRADKSVPYGEIMKVMDLLRAAGFLKVALVALEGTGTL